MGDCAVVRVGLRPAGVLPVGPLPVRALAVGLLIGVLLTVGVVVSGVVGVLVVVHEGQSGLFVSTEFHLHLVAVDNEEV